jgi:Lipid A core - O-antigen ligase and related enzymes
MLIWPDGGEAKLLNNSFASNAIWGLFFASPMLAPFLINPNVFPLHAAPFFLSLAALAAMASNQTGGLTRPSPTQLSFVGVLFAGQVILFVMGGISSLQGFSNWFIILVTAFAAYLLAQHQTDHHCRYIMIIFVAVALCWIMVAAPVWLGWTPHRSALTWGPIAFTTDFQFKINGPFVNGNVFGILVACAWAIALREWAHHQKPAWHWLWWIAMTLFWIWSITSLSRGVWLAQGLATLLFAAYLWRGKRKLIPLLLLSGALAWTAATLLTTLPATPSHAKKLDVQERLHTTVESGLGARLLIWRSAVEMIREHPVLGVGLGNFGAHYLSAQASTLSDPKLQNTAGLKQTGSAHNLLLHAWAEAGIPGLVLWLVISVYAVSDLSPPFPCRHRYVAPVCSPDLCPHALGSGLFQHFAYDPFPAPLPCPIPGLGHGWHIHKCATTCE